MTKPYDSTADTEAHIRRVQQLIGEACWNLAHRSAEHDRSKLEPPEKEAFDRGTPALKGLTYGSQEYKDAFAKYGMKEAIAHHYAHNSHHPEHWAFRPDGILDDEVVKSGEAIARMSLLDIVEMVAADWPAAVERHADGNLIQSLEVNRERFGIGDQLARIILNTWIEMGLL